MKTFYLDEETHWETLGEDINRKVMSWSDGLMMVCVHFAQGAVGMLTSTRSMIRLLNVAAERFEVTIDGETRILVAGDAYRAV